MDAGAVDLRPAHQPPVHPQGQPADPRRSGRLRSLLQPGEPPAARRVRTLPDASPTTFWSSATRPTSTSSGSATRAWKTPPTSPRPTSSPTRSWRTSVPPSSSWRRSRGTWGRGQPDVVQWKPEAPKRRKPVPDANTYTLTDTKHCVRQRESLQCLGCNAILGA